jgi:hypothetical protein
LVIGHDVRGAFKCRLVTSSATNQDNANNRDCDLVEHSPALVGQTDLGKILKFGGKLPAYGVPY